MNKKFLSAILFGALMVTSTGTFVSCKDYDDDIEQLSTEKDKLAQQIAELEKQVGDELKPELEALKNQLNSQNADLNAIKAALEKLQNGLTSLVFVPEFYYGGIEAMTVGTYKYESLETETVSANDVTGEEDAPKPGSMVEMAPRFGASYHVNPSSVSAQDILDITFLTGDKEYESVAQSRAYEGAIVAEVLPGWTVNNGILDVTGVIKDGSIKMDAENVTVLAAQASINRGNEQVTVTSDYAVVRSEVTYIEDLALIGEQEDIHLYETAADAVENGKDGALLQVEWNKTFDLADVIRTHIDDCSGSLDAEGEEDWGNANNGVAAKKGFNYVYELVGWADGSNETSESVHAALEGSVLRPQMPKDGAQQAYGAEQSKATIGRLPLVRVTLEDKVSGNKAAVGYLLIEIVAETPEPVQPTKKVVVFDQFNQEFTVDCEGESYVNKLTWFNVEEKILALLSLDKTTFEAEYELQDNNDEALQFVSTEINSAQVVNPLGKVSLTEVDEDGHMTEVLLWTLTENEAYQAFKGGETSISVNVRFKKKTAEEYVYVTFVWTPEPLNITPNGEIANSAKINKYWYAQNGAVAGEGYSDIHANVKQVNSLYDCTFDSDVLNTLTGNKITVTNDDTYPAFADAELNKNIVFAPVQDHLTKNAAGSYVVNGASGAIYAITVSNEGLTLVATDVETLESADVVVLEETVMKYQDNAIAKDILNNADHNQLGQDETFTAKLMFTAEKCEYIPYTLKNDVFYAKYLRPVSVDPSDVENLVDATNGASIAELMLNLIDWRDKHFDVAEETKGDDGVVYDCYRYYGVTTVEADIEGATTDLNDGDIKTQLLSKVTNNVDLRFGADEEGANSYTIAMDEETGKYNNGKFFYYNNGNTLGEFTIRVPLVVTYKWGKIYTSVDLIINKTVNN